MTLRSPRLSARAAVALLTVVVAGIVLAGAVAAQEATPVLPQQRKSLVGAKLPEEIQWWVYNKQTGAFEVTATHPEQWEPVMRQAPSGTTIGFANMCECIDFTVKVGNSVEARAKEAGIELLRLDNKYPDSQAPLTNADIIASRNVDLAISFNVLAPVAGAIMEKYNEKKIPAIAVDVVHPGAVFFGADNYQAGYFAGEYAAKWAKEHGWQGSDIALVVAVNPNVGEVPNLRGLGFRDAVRAAFPDILDSKVFELPSTGTTDGTLANMSAWLTAHPNEHHILAGSINDQEGTGISGACDTAGRTSDCAVVGQGADEPALAELRKPENAFKGSVAYFPERYGDRLIPLALDILEGKPVPEEVHVVHEVVTRENVDTLYPRTQ